MAVLVESVFSYTCACCFKWGENHCRIPKWSNARAASSYQVEVYVMQTLIRPKIATIYGAQRRQQRMCSRLTETSRPTVYTHSWRKLFKSLTSLRISWKTLVLRHIKWSQEEMTAITRMKIICIPQISIWMLLVYSTIFYFWPASVW